MMTPHRDLAGRTVLITGANRGLGAALVDVVIARGAAKVYAAARDVASLAGAEEAHRGRLVPIALDVTDDAQVSAAGASLDDVDVLISNAGVTYMVPLAQTTIEGARQTMETNYFGPLRLIAAFGPRLNERGGGFISILSLAGLVPAGDAELYSASKAAGIMLGHAARRAYPGIAVSLSYPGLMDTDMMRSADLPKTSPRDIARNTIDGWMAGDLAIFPDRHARMLRDELLASPSDLIQDPYAIMNRALTAYLSGSGE